VKGRGGDRQVSIACGIGLTEYSPTNATGNAMTLKTKLLIHAADPLALPALPPAVRRCVRGKPSGQLPLCRCSQIADQTDTSGSSMRRGHRNGTIMANRPSSVAREPTAGAPLHVEAGAGEQGAPCWAGHCPQYAGREAKAAELKIPFVCDNATARHTGKNCNLHLPAEHAGRGAKPMLAVRPAAKWYHITASLFGQDI
jgi:hypothetical protein